MSEKKGTQVRDSWGRLLKMDSEFRGKKESYGPTRDSQSKSVLRRAAEASAWKPQLQKEKEKRSEWYSGRYRSASFRLETDGKEKEG